MTNKASRDAERRPPGKNLAATLAAQGVVVPRPADVAAYLVSHRALARIVPLVCEQARREFDQGAELLLEVYRDPEIDDRHLTLYVRLPSYEGDAIITRLDRVTQPFEDELCSASGYLLVTTDFRPPQAMHDLSQADCDGLALASNPQFQALIADARRSLQKEAGVRLEDFREELDLPAKPRSRPRKKKS